MITTDEVQGVIERTLTPDELRVIPNWIAQAEDILRRHVRDLDARMSMADSAPAYLSETTVKRVLTRMVERKARNPNAYRQVSSDGAQATIDSNSSAGKLYLSEEDIDDLAPLPITGWRVPGAFSLQVGI